MIDSIREARRLAAGSAAEHAAAMFAQNDADELLDVEEADEDDEVRLQLQFFTCAVSQYGEAYIL